MEDWLVVWKKACMHTRERTCIRGLGWGHSGLECLSHDPEPRNGTSAFPGSTIPYSLFPPLIARLSDAGLLEGNEYLLDYPLRLLRTLLC